MRWMGAGTSGRRQNAESPARGVAFQRQRAPNIGAASRAWRKTSSTAAGFRKSKTSSSGNECCSVSEMTMPLSVAAACSSKLKVRQKRLRRARPQRAVDARTEGGMENELHAAGLIEEALGDDGGLGRQDTERGDSGSRT